MAAYLFAAAPPALMFCLGQYRERLGRVQLYEHDFKARSYRPAWAPKLGAADSSLDAPPSGAHAGASVRSAPRWEAVRRAPITHLQVDRHEICTHDSVARGVGCNRRF